MKKTLIAATTLTYLCGVALAAADPPPPDVDAAVWIKAIYTAVTSKNWGLVVGLALIALVFPMRKYGPAIFKSKLGGLLLAFATSLAGTLGAAFAAGAKPDLPLVVTALTTAATAAGLWAWIKDHLPGAQAASDKITAEAPPSTNFTAAGAVALALLSVTAGAACSAEQRAAGKTALVDCVKAEGASVIPELLPVAVIAIQAATNLDGTKIDVATLAPLVAKAVSPIAQCVWASAFAKLLAPVPPPAPGAPAAAPFVVDKTAVSAAFEQLRPKLGGRRFVTESGEL